jgi:hypothetical protein
MAAPEWKLEEDNKTVTATFPTDPPTTMKFTTEEVEKIMKDLAELRWDMEPEVPDNFEEDEAGDPVEDPIWETAPDEDNRNMLLHICDPRYGWLHYALPNDEAEKLAEYLKGD